VVERRVLSIVYCSASSLSRYGARSKSGSAYTYIHLRCKNFRSPKQWLLISPIKRHQNSSMWAIKHWHIWEARNAVGNGERNIHPHCFASKIYDYVDLVLLHLCKTVAVHSHEMASCSLVRWSPLPPGTVLVNVGATVFSHLHKVRVGI
jgi:hypothetical protein